MSRTLSVIIFSLAAIFVAGCNAPPQPSGPTEIIVHITDRDRFFDDSMTVLRENDMHPRQLERDTGLIVTAPTTSAQWFEFWRNDTRGGYNFAEANLHTVRHIVTLRLDPKQDAAASQPSDVYRLSIQCDKQRLGALERQVTTPGAAYSIFSERTPTVEGYRDPLGATRQWVPQGRNGLLESYLLKRIVEATGAVSVLPGDDFAEPMLDAESQPTDTPL